MPKTVDKAPGGISRQTASAETTFRLLGVPQLPGATNNEANMPMTRSVFLYLFALHVMVQASLLGTAPTSPSCSDTSGGRLDWVDSGYIQNQQKTEATVGSELCNVSENCNDSIRLRLNSATIKLTNQTIRFKIYINNSGKITKLTRINSEKSERPFPQLQSIIPNTLTFVAKHSNGNFNGSIKTNATGQISYFWLNAFLSNHDSKENISIRPISDSIFRIGDRRSESIAKIVSIHRKRFKEIYAEYSKTAPGLSGKISLTFTISAKGNVISISRISSVSNCRPMDKDIIEAVKLMKFDEIPFGKVTVTRSFALDTK